MPVALSAGAEAEQASHPPPTHRTFKRATPEQRRVHTMQTLGIQRGSFSTTMDRWVVGGSFSGAGYRIATEATVPTLANRCNGPRPNLAQGAKRPKHQFSLNPPANFSGRVGEPEVFGEAI